MARIPHPLAYAALSLGFGLGACSPAFQPAYPEPVQPAARSNVEKEAPAPPPAPPAPRVDRFEVCALAPATPAGLRALPALHVEGSRDTLAVVEGRRVSMSEAVGPATVAGEQAWFTARKTLDLRVGGRAYHFGLYDSARIIDAGDLAYLGTSAGLPVFVAGADVEAVRDELTKRLATSHDLGTVLATPTLRAAFRQVQVLYVPVRPTGCVFQPLLRNDLR